MTWIARFNRQAWTGAAICACGLLQDLTLSAPVHAATQGALGATSTGTISITLSVAPRTRISGLTDVTFDNLDPTRAASAAQDICIWSNSPSGTYTVTARGSGPGGGFMLANGSRTVRYKVGWTSTANGGPGNLSSGVPSRTLTSSASDPSCRSKQESARLLLEVVPSDLRMAEPDAAYIGILHLTVSPQ